MATRSIVSVALPNGAAIYHFYRHHDGMPFRGGADLATLLHRTGSCVTGFLEELTGATYSPVDRPLPPVGRSLMVFDEVGPRDEWADLDRTDCNWLYEFRFHAGPMVDLDLVPAVTVRVLKRDEPEPVFAGGAVDFLHWIDRQVHCVNVQHDAGLVEPFDADGVFVRERTSYEPEHAGA